jgi:hypothetical protein
MSRPTRRFLAVSLFTIALLALAAAPALADGDPFSQPLGGVSTDTGSPSGITGNDPFSLVGSTTTYDPTGDTTGSPTGSDPTGTADGYDPGGSPTGALPFTGADSQVWLVAAYGLLGAGALLLIIAEAFGVSRRRRSLASPSRAGAARSFESSP